MMQPGQTIGTPAKARNGLDAAPQSTSLQSRTTVVFVGLAYLFTCIGFSYVDRSYRSFGFFSAVWVVWTVLGFGAGLRNLRGADNAGRTQAIVLGALGFALALFPGLLMFPFFRWLCVVLLLLMGARAARMRTRRDLYLTMVVIFTVCFLTTTHYAADWSLWFYLGPAWLCAALALAWVHAEGVDLSRWSKLFMTLGFVAVSFAIAAALFLFAPRPPVLGFGFLPGGDVEGLYNPPSGGQNNKGRAEDYAGRPGGAGGSGAGSPGDQGSSGDGGWGGGGGERPGQSRPQPGSPSSSWGRMLDGMREAGRDPFAPKWQRNAINGALDAAQALRNWLRGTGPASAGGGAAGAGNPDGPGDSMGLQNDEPGSGGGRQSSQGDMLLAMALALLAWLLWRNRYRWGAHTALAGAWCLSRWFPAQSMQWSARAMTWWLRARNHRPQPGQSVREHWSSAPDVAPLARQWTERALETYCATRFGAQPATRERALRLREDVRGAIDVMGNVVPELAR